MIFGMSKQCRFGSFIYIHKTPVREGGCTSGEIKAENLCLAFSKISNHIPSS